MSVQIHSVSVSVVCAVCCLTQYFVMSQARDFEGFLMKHMTEEEKVIDLREIPLKN